MKSLARLVVLSLFLGAGNAARSKETEPLGRLFFTPEQRLAIDRRHANGTADTAESEDASSVDGEIWRGKQRRIRWINGRTEDAHEARTPALPVGDSIEHASGKRKSLLGDGRLHIKRDTQK